MTNVFNNDLNLMIQSFKTPSGPTKLESPEVFKVAKLIEITEHLQQLLDMKNTARKANLGNYTAPLH